MKIGWRHVLGFLEQETSDSVKRGDPVPLQMMISLLHQAAVNCYEMRRLFADPEDPMRYGIRTCPCCGIEYEGWRDTCSKRCRTITEYPPPPDYNQLVEQAKAQLARIEAEEIEKARP